MAFGQTSTDRLWRRGRNTLHSTFAIPSGGLRRPPSVSKIMPNIKALVTASGFLALLLAVGAIFMLVGFGQDAVASMAHSIDEKSSDGSAGGLPIFIGFLFALTAVVLFVALKLKR